MQLRLLKIQDAHAVIHSAFIMCSMIYAYAIYRFFLPIHRARDKFLANAEIVLSDNLDRFSCDVWPIFIRGSTL